MSKTAYRWVLRLTFRCPSFRDAVEMEMRKTVFLFPFLVGVVLLRCFLVNDFLVTEVVGGWEALTVGWPRSGVWTSSG